jgi:predicted enzyme related to lactoylglutathione lyase
VGDGYTPSNNGATVYFSVNDIDQTLRNVTRNGGKVLKNRYSIGEYGNVAVGWPDARHFCLAFPIDAVAPWSKDAIVP